MIRTIFFEPKCLSLIINHCKPFSGRDINIPAAPRYYWRYRMHLTLEELLRQEPFNATLREMIIAGGRR